MVGLQRYNMLVRTVGLILASCLAVILRADGLLAPLNRVVYEGATNTTITCESNDIFMDWLINPFAVYDDLSMLTGNGEIVFPFNESFAIDHSQGTEVHTLVIFNATISPSYTTISTAGIYQCYNYESESAVSAHLVVVRTDPICSSNFTQSTAMLQSGDAIQMSCTIVYGAFKVYRIDAVMSWSVNGQPIPANNATFKIKTTPTEITATSTIFVNKNYDATYECATTFSEPYYPPPRVAYNAPDYFKTCTIRLIQPTTMPTTAPTNTTSSLSQSATTTAEVTSTTAEETFTTISSSSSTSTLDQYNNMPNLKNMVVYEGQQNTVMHQGTHPQSITWSVLPSSDEISLLTIIDLGGNMNPMLTNLYDANLADLVIKNATTIGNPISTAGLYVSQCDNDFERTGAKLLVIRTGPVCSSIPIDSTSSIVSCYVAFADIVLHPMYPIITWKLNGVFLASHTLQMERIDPYVFYAQSNITSDSGVPENYTCELTFAAPIDIKYPWIATNAPEFKASCSTTG